MILTVNPNGCIGGNDLLDLLDYHAQSYPKDSEAHRAIASIYSEVCIAYASFVKPTITTKKDVAI
jgi:hypothetical protein